MTVLRSLLDDIAPPGTRPGDMLAISVTSLAGALLAITLGLRAGLTPMSLLVVTVVALDLFGGAVVNATDAAKRRFHAPGRSGRHHLGFVAVHLHPFLMALVVPEFGWGAAAAVYGMQVAGACAVLATPGRSRRPVAFGVTVLGVALALTLLPIPTVVVWFAPIILVKLLLAHLLQG